MPSDFPFLQDQLKVLPLDLKRFWLDARLSEYLLISSKAEMHETVSQAVRELIYRLSWVMYGREVMIGRTVKDRVTEKVEESYEVNRRELYPATFQDALKRWSAHKLRYWLRKTAKFTARDRDGDKQVFYTLADRVLSWQKVHVRYTAYETSVHHTQHKTVTHEDVFQHWHVCPHLDVPNDRSPHYNFLQMSQPFQGTAEEEQALRKIADVLVASGDSLYRYPTESSLFCGSPEYSLPRVVGLADAVKHYRAAQERHRMQQ